MSSKRSSMVYVALALLLGTGSAFLVQRWAEQRMVAAQQHAADEGAQVVVAAREIEFGKRIEPNHLKLVPWPASALPEGAFSNLSDVVGKLSKHDILPGEPVLAARVADPASGALLASLIEPNKRAVAVRVDDVVGVGGFLLPGSRVDVVASRRIEENRYDTRTVLYNLKVLAVDQTAS
ncbi:MAG TPA: Flp pilus assembly protein CpaB, partial [Nevskiaceae bacterium]|nr:Flp pilus assembly protein CpaB [Nevskiaceae bacterium]